MDTTHKNKGPRACSTCAKAKSRCAPSPVANICERCHRLGKTCGSQTPAPPRKRKASNGLGVLLPPSSSSLSGVSRANKPVKPTRVAELERRLEDLTTRLESVSRQQQQQQQQQQQKQHPSPLNSFRNPNQLPGLFPIQLFDIQQPPEQQQQQQQQQQQHADTPSKMSPPSSFSRPTASTSPANATSSPESASTNAQSSGSISSNHLQRTQSLSEFSVPSSAPTTNEVDTDDVPLCGRLPAVEEAVAAATAAATATAPTATAAPTAPTPQSVGRRPAPLCGMQHILPVTDIDSPQPQTPQTTPPSTTLASLLTVPTPPGLWPEGDEAEMLLAEYRSHLMPLLPFVVLPKDMGSAELRATRPLLWKSVMMAITHLDGGRQILMGNQLVGELTVAAFVRPQRSLEVLQALLMTIPWFHYNVNSFQLTNLLFLTRGMCIGLGLGEMPSDGAENTTPEMLEKMRAYAGTFYVLTSVFTTTKKSDMMLSTPYLDLCCQVLERRCEVPSDAYLVQLIRIQQLGQSVALSFMQRNAGMAENLCLSMMVGVMQQQIETYKAQVPEHMRHDISLRAHIHIVEIMVYEVGLQEPRGPGSLPTDERLRMLHACVQSIHAFMTNRFSEHMREQPRFLCIGAFDYLYAFLLTLKLMTLQLEGWDVRKVRKEVEFDLLVDAQIEEMTLLAERRKRRTRFDDRFAKAAEAALEGKPDPFARLTNKLLELRQKIVAELERMTGPVPNVTTSEMRMAETATTTAPPTAPPTTGDVAVASTTSMEGNAMNVGGSSLTAASGGSVPLDGSGTLAMDAYATLPSLTPPDAEVAAEETGAGVMPASFSDATLDYIHSFDSIMWQELVEAPGWESYMGANMETPYLDNWE